MISINAFWIIMIIMVVVAIISAKTNSEDELNKFFEWLKSVRSFIWSVFLIFIVCVLVFGM